MDVSDLIDFSLTLAGFAGSALLLVYGLSMLWSLGTVLFGRKRHHDAHSALRGGCAKHDWGGYNP